MVNGRTSKTRGIGDVSLKTKYGDKLVLRDVKFVPNIKMNFISIGKLADDGYMCEFGSHQCKHKLGSQVVAVGHRKSTLYKCQLNVAKGSKRQWMPVKAADGSCKGTVEPTTMIANFDQSDQDPSVQKKLESQGEKDDGHRLSPIIKGSNELKKLLRRVETSKWKAKTVAKAKGQVSSLVAGLNRGFKSFLECIFYRNNYS
ncbi:MAG: hypothetical protein Q8836_02565, partial [Sweet potato little leaf phytoplasma]|nr:hypothetical protein [Sweet potato little leaf phytoplasma]